MRRCSYCHRRADRGFIRKCRRCSGLLPAVVKAKKRKPDKRQKKLF